MVDWEFNWLKSDSMALRAVSFNTRVKIITFPSFFVLHKASFKPHFLLMAPTFRHALPTLEVNASMLFKSAIMKMRRTLSRG